MTPDEWKAKEDELKKRPVPPILSPEQKVETIQQYKALPKDRQALLKRLLQHPCSYCEAEFKVPNVGKSHGMCPRHLVTVRQEYGLEPPSEADLKNSKTVDLKELSPEELKLAVNLYGIVSEKERSKLKTRKDLNPA